MACIGVFVSTAIHVNKIPISSDVISRFYIAEFIAIMAEVWKQFILNLSLWTPLENKHICFSQLIYDS